MTTKIGRKRTSTSHPTTISTTNDDKISESASSKYQNHQNTVIFKSIAPALASTRMVQRSNRLKNIKTSFSAPKKQHNITKIVSKSTKRNFINTSRERAKIQSTKMKA